MATKTPPPMVRPVAPLALAFAAAVGACSGDGQPNSGVDPSAPLTDLSHEELIAVCDATYGADPVEYGISEDEALRYSCYWRAIWFRTEFPILGANCDERALECLQNGEPVGLLDQDQSECDEIRTDPGSTGADLPECASQISVGELEACFGALASRVNEMADTISCSTPVDQVLLLPSECAELEERCPDLF